jgi:cytochrome c oxidase subunit 2
LSRAREQPDENPLAPRDDRYLVRVVSGATVLTALMIVALTVLSYLTDKNLLSLAMDNPVLIRVTGHQWWWEVRYENAAPSRIFTVANEIHVPTGRPVRLKLESLDVIHSFWVPNLAGKMDLIPGHTNELTFTVEQPGIYRGQCAEFCGYQHANMKMLVFADRPEEFKAWVDHQIQPADNRAVANAQGSRVFLSSGCVLCHTVRGTSAGGKAGPELTHFGSRSSIAANTMPLTHDGLVAWIADPQHIKPGANMPRVELSEADRDAVAQYLEGLK